MIDIHSHILHGMDDGPARLEDSVELAVAAVNNGVTAIIATPHHKETFHNDAIKVEQAVKELNFILNARGIPLYVYPGQEIRAHEKLLEDLESGKLHTLGSSSYLLIEFPSSRIPERFEDTIHELSIAGLTPIIAHPERNAEIAGRPERLAELVLAGALCQVTSHSLTGIFGRKVLRLAYTLIQRNLIHLIASDAHNLTTRPYQLLEAYNVVSSRFGLSTTEYFKANAYAVLHNLSILRRPYIAPRGPGRLLAGWPSFKI
ncbi:tyrosine-protein phosphatase [Paenibacillus abyssi]|uniref:Tyrosine-protein phosphatase n=1 Tax=Paenibacillus abyssi TaxID=1340531 RepID=A0A917CUE0_9BACL|nr:CpsB/CapC family capsule biosynthesis tyrosine phosphatase [Paenibacillus abyssi]GGF98631.1 tyrosine protein phosphatase [Paenibacillus abyssi]